MTVRERTSRRGRLLLGLALGYFMVLLDSCWTCAMNPNLGATTDTQGRLDPAGSVVHNGCSSSPAIHRNGEGT